MIEVENLVKKYGRHIAVDHLSFHVEKGQIYGFLGPNGAGKSTTMNMITGYIAATEGSVKINGHDILKEPEEAKKCIGYLPELPPLYMDMTVKEYLKFAAELKRIPKKDHAEQLEKVMELTMTDDVSGRLIKNLSKGYRQRVGLAQALLGEPEVLILDEPTVGLDPKQIIEIRDLIRKLGENHTVILSSHILSEISAICDHIMIISKGKLVASDSPQGLTQMLASKNRLHLELLGDTGRTKQLLSEIPGVSEIKEIAGEGINSEEMTSAFEITFREEADLRQQIFHACAEADIPILSMYFEKGSLEDIFLELTE